MICKEVLHNTLFVLYLFLNNSKNEILGDKASKQVNRHGFRKKANSQSGSMWHSRVPL